MPESANLLDVASLARLIDHTLLRADATRREIAQLCDEARQFGFASVCVNPFWVAEARRGLDRASSKVCTVIGFPLGATSTQGKVAEARAALQDGAQELDMVINVGALKSGEPEAVEADIAAVAEAAHSGAAILKVILETALLNDDQKRLGSELALRAGADFLKTSTGFSTGGATIADVQLLRSVAGARMGVKASGGIRTIEDVRAMVNAGASRIGASAGVQIIRGLRASASADY